MNDSEAPPVGRVLRRAREHHNLTLREVERRTGRANAYLSQVERGVIRRPDPLVLIELAKLYELDFPKLAHWAGIDDTSNSAVGPKGDELLRTLVESLFELNDDQRSEALRYIEQLRHNAHT